jgi:hypothetical protein
MMNHESKIPLQVILHHSAFIISCLVSLLAMYRNNLDMALKCRFRWHRMLFFGIFGPLTGFRGRAIIAVGGFTPICKFQHLFPEGG